MASLYSAIVTRIGQLSDAARSTASDGSTTAISMVISEVAARAVEMARAKTTPPMGVVRRERRGSVARRHTNQWPLVAAVCSLSLFGAVACSDEATPNSPNNSMGGSATANAGASGASGAGQTVQGGSSNTGGSGGSSGAEAAAGTAGTGGAAEDPTTPLSPNQCTGISSDDPCQFVGSCAGRVCGLADLGTRDCTCTLAKVWDCTSCAFPMGPNQPSVLIPPGTGDAGALRTCEVGVAREVTCSPMGDRCQQGEDVCACWVIDDGMNVWDCDNPPSFWP